MVFQKPSESNVLRIIKFYQTLLKWVKLELNTERRARPCGGQCTFDKKNLGGVQ